MLNLVIRTQSFRAFRNWGKSNQEVEILSARIVWLPYIHERIAKSCRCSIRLLLFEVPNMDFETTM